MKLLKRRTQDERTACLPSLYSHRFCRSFYVLSGRLVKKLAQFTAAFFTGISLVLSIVMLFLIDKQGEAVYWFGGWVPPLRHRIFCRFSQCGDSGFNLHHWFSNDDLRNSFYEE